jgi:hypothetical protein
MEDSRKQQAEKRTLLSSFFITLLIGMGYQEMILVVKESVTTNGIDLGTYLLTAIFFLISMRFFIGNQLHLLSDSFVRLHGLVWLYDLIVIIIQCIALVLLGGFSSVKINRKVSIGFLEFMVALYVIDIVWIFSQWILGKFFLNWKREFVPWAWAILNTSLVIFIIILNTFIDDLYSAKGLIWLCTINLIGFIVDVVLVDYYDAI